VSRGGGLRWSRLSLGKWVFVKGLCVLGCFNLVIEGGGVLFDRVVGYLGCRGVGI